MEPLERGILIGRYERCLNLGDELSVLSRVHLLISKIGLDVVAIDTASTFGSIRKAGAFESVVLNDKDEGTPRGRAARRVELHEAGRRLKCGVMPALIVALLPEADAFPTLEEIEEGILYGEMLSEVGCDVLRSTEVS